MAKIFTPTDNIQSISTIINQKSMSGALYLGNINAAINLQLLISYKIKAILTIIDEQIKIIPFSNQIKHLFLQADDCPFENIKPYFTISNQFIYENISKRRNVLVHCRAGISRSATLVIAYLMSTKSYSLKKALFKVKSKRSIIKPNQGFMMQLKDYERKISKDNKQQI